MLSKIQNLAKTEAQLWFDEQEKNGFPALLRGDIFLSRYHGLIGTLIGFFQGRPGHTIPWSHTGIYIGSGKIAEGAFPTSRVWTLREYLDAKHDLSLFRVTEWDDVTRALVTSQATLVAEKKTPYDKLNILRHLFDNFIEIITWNNETQTGKRPLAGHIRDRDGEKRLVCSEFVEAVVYWATKKKRESMVPSELLQKTLVQVLGDKFQSGNVGQARPWDVYRWLIKEKHGVMYFAQKRGKLIGNKSE